MPSRSLPAYPLGISENRRHLVDGRGRPYLLQGDAAWSLITNLQLPEAERYLEDRGRRGFNSTWTGLIEHLFCADPPRNLYGEAPFNVAGDLTTPNEKYFEHADRVIVAAARNGIQLLLTPCYLGYIDPHYPGYAGAAEGWYEEILANGPEGCREWGRYLGRRFGHHDNLLWVMGGDRNPGEALECIREIALGIKEKDSRHLFTAHVHPECSPLDVYPGQEWLDLNLTYSYGIVHRLLATDYNRTPIWPFVLAESTYEGEHNSTAQQIRRQAYWAILCGASGQCMGNKPIWMFDPGWEEALGGEGSRSMEHLRSLFETLPWWQLVPDLDHRLVVAGVGEFRGLDYAAAARTDDGRLGVAYLPTPRAVSVDLALLQPGWAQVTWFDPASGASQAGGEIKCVGHAVLTPPSDHDSVLLLKSTGGD